MESSLKVLIVEDEFLISMQLESELSDGGYNVLKIVSSGEKALKIVSEISPDLILMDINLAGEIDGIETARKIQSFSKNPIIFMSGYSDSKTKNRINSVDSLGFLIKPIFLSDLKPIIDGYFGPLR